MAETANTSDVETSSNVGTSATTTPTQEQARDQHHQQQEHEELGPCCFLLKFGKCEPPVGRTCRFRHDMIVDDGVTPCCFGATCRMGHKTRMLPRHADQQERLAYWNRYHEQTKRNQGTGITPASRDATLLQSQLEPWPTAVLRQRLVKVFGESYQELDGLPRGDIMNRLLMHYQNYNQKERNGINNPPRKIIRVLGTPIRQELQTLLLHELRQWRTRHLKHGNTRPSIHAECYMILRSPMEFQTKVHSNKAQSAAKKLHRHERLWELAKTAMLEVDADYGHNFSALAVTYGFQGSPHIDKQNTCPFYGLALGDFPDGQGGVCVEVDAFTVAHVNTKNRLAKVDGRYPHWVAPYKKHHYNGATVNGSGGGCERYSLIYYSTWQEYVQPKQAFFGPVMDEQKEEEKFVNKVS